MISEVQAIEIARAYAVAHALPKLMCQEPRVTYRKRGIDLSEPSWYLKRPVWDVSGIQIDAETGDVIDAHYIGKGEPAIPGVISMTQAAHIAYTYKCRKWAEWREEYQRTSPEEFESSIHRYYDWHPFRIELEVDKNLGRQVWCFYWCWSGGMGGVTLLTLDAATGEVLADRVLSNH